MHVLTISGSLRAASSNSTLLRVLPALAPDGVSITTYEGLGTLPPFNPDLDTDDGSPAVTDLRARLRAADAVVICSPEYAHGVPGVLKNALDWIVGSGEFMHKPVGLINASPASVYAQAQLAETLTVMMANVLAEASPTVAVQGRRLDEAGILADADLTATLRSALRALQQVVVKRSVEPA